MLNRRVWESAIRSISPDPDDKQFGTNFRLIPIFEEYSNDKLQDEYIKRSKEVAQMDGKAQFTDPTLIFLIREMKKRHKEGRVDFSEFDVQRSEIPKILGRQVDIFHDQYEIRKYEQADDEGKEQFITELKYWIKKFETAEKLKTAQVSLKNSLIKFTDVELFQHEAQLETVKLLLPFLRTQLKVVHDRTLPTVRKSAILPLGSTTAGEMLLMVAEITPEIAQMSKTEQFAILNKSIQKVASIVREVDPSAYDMDTNTLNSLVAQQIQENEEAYKILLTKSEEALQAIQDAPTNLDHAQKVKLQQNSVQIQMKLPEYRKWFAGLNIPFPVLRDQGPTETPSGSNFEENWWKRILRNVWRRIVLSYEFANRHGLLFSIIGFVISLGYAITSYSLYGTAIPGEVFRYIFQTDWIVEASSETIDGNVSLSKDTRGRDSLFVWADTNLRLSVKIANNVSRKLRIRNADLLIASSNQPVTTPRSHSDIVIEGNDFYEYPMPTIMLKENLLLLNSFVNLDHKIKVSSDRGSKECFVNAFVIIGANGDSLFVKTR